MTLKELFSLEALPLEMQRTIWVQACFFSLICSGLTGGMAAYMGFNQGEGQSRDLHRDANYFVELSMKNNPKQDRATLQATATAQADNWETYRVVVPAIMSLLCIGGNFVCHRKLKAVEQKLNPKP